MMEINQIDRLDKGHLNYSSFGQGKFPGGAVNMYELTFEGQ